MSVENGERVVSHLRRATSKFFNSIDLVILRNSGKLSNTSLKIIALSPPFPMMAQQIKIRLKCLAISSPPVSTLNCLHFHLTTICLIVLSPRTYYALMRKLFPYYLLLIVLRLLALMGFQPVCLNQLLTALHLL